MNFKDLLKKYKEGSASQEEIKIVESEFEKYEAIEDYISQSIKDDLKKDLEMDLDFSLPEDSSATDDPGIIQKNVNKRLRKVVLTSVSIVLAIYFIIFFIVSPVMDSFYYNPTKVSVGKNTPDFFYDMTAITSLNMPGTSLYGASAYKDGFGKYNVSISRKDLFQQKTEELNLKLRRNMRDSFRFTESDHYDFPFLLNNVSDDFVKNNNNRVISDVSELNPVSYISSYISFKKDLTMEEFLDLREKYINNNIEFIWAAIRTEPKINYKNSEVYSPIITGFSLDFGAGARPSDELPNIEKYPAFDYLEWTKNNSNIDNRADGYALHYKNLLQYVIDRNTASDTIEGALKHDYYKDYLEYVEKNGVKTFGLLIYADARDLLEFIENENVESIQLNEVIPLRKSFGIY